MTFGHYYCYCIVQSRTLHEVYFVSFKAREWRLKWSLDMKFSDATVEDLIRDMADSQVNVRLVAITTCARASEYRLAGRTK